MRSTINWNEVRKRAIDKGVRTDAGIARKCGLHINTIGKNDTYRSATLDALANFLGCKPEDILSWEPVEGEELCLA